ncbi:hypothetical protein ACOME3_004041 [Neoechinorhynchus agilis]
MADSMELIEINLLLGELNSVHSFSFNSTTAKYLPLSGNKSVLTDGISHFSVLNEDFGELLTVSIQCSSFFVLADAVYSQDNIVRVALVSENDKDGISVSIYQCDLLRHKANVQFLLNGKHVPDYVHFIGNHKLCILGDMFHFECSNKNEKETENKDVVWWQDGKSVWIQLQFASNVLLDSPRTLTIQYNENILKANLEHEVDGIAITSIGHCKEIVLKKRDVVNWHCCFLSHPCVEVVGKEELFLGLDRRPLYNVGELEECDFGDDSNQSFLQGLLDKVISAQSSIQKLWKVEGDEVIGMVCTETSYMSTTHSMAKDINRLLVLSTDDYEHNIKDGATLAKKIRQYTRHR